ncbi:hypothetical protein J2X15_003212 [Rhodoferax saidenbachensis]|uniref:Bulb-type lectin domain-containing protein n=2 Tax=Rhodoferax saidenbachensis TaxID=1484693 RepID=A0ABU1ZQS0_9BURK|nr:hypothetical protein [Rhodoferax saidenbachensis]
MTDRLTPDQTLAAGSEIASPNGQHRAVMQGDGNFVVYRANGTPKWATGTDGRAIGGIIMQGDGNLVMYDSNGPVWASGTDGHPGAVLVMQDDGNLVIYGVDGTPLWATGTNITMMRVTGFLPTMNGFHFSNAFAHAPDIQINILGQNVAIGDAANGLCGGMAFAARDFFQAGQRPPARKDSPTSGVLFDLLVRRLFDSFEIPVGPARYAALMSPDLPDHETALSEIGLAPHGRAWVTIVEEWPKIRAGIDGGMPMPMALILIKDRDVFQMGNNHQVLAYGYDMDGNDLSILVYDPNCPDDNNVRINLDLGNPRQTTRMWHSHIDSARKEVVENVFAFFSQGYAFIMPPAIPTPDPAAVERSFKITNATPGDQLVKVFNPGDTAMLAPLPAGEFNVPPNQFGTWVFHKMLSQVRLTANDRFLGLASPGDAITITGDDTVEFRNTGQLAMPVRVYKATDDLMWVTLPGGQFTVGAGEIFRYTIPADVTTIKAIINGQRSNAVRGQVIIF